MKIFFTHLSLIILLVAYTPTRSAPVDHSEVFKAADVLNDSTGTRSFLEAKVDRLQRKIADMTEFMILLGLLFLMVFVSMMMVFSRLKKIQRIIMDDDYLVMRFFKTQEKLKKADSEHFQIHLQRLLKSMGISTNGKRVD